MKSYSKFIFGIIISIFIVANMHAQCPTFACFPSGPSSNAILLGPTNFSLSTINNNSSDKSVDPIYNDYSCFISTTLHSGYNYSFSSTNNGSINEKFKMWIDYNNNGVFENATELIFEGTYGFSATINSSISVPLNSVVKNTNLRLRIATEASGSIPISSCTNPRYGQIEDYSVRIEDNLAVPPIANFTANTTNSCNGIIQFTDETANIPTTWNWDFGDGNSSNSQNPTHTYSNTGTYTVKLVTTNANGSDSITKTNYINYSNSSPISASCYPSIASNAGLGFACGIFNFTLNTINNSSNGDTDGYQDYSCNQNTTLFESTPYNISITTGNNFQENVKVFVDINGDGTFQAGEQLFSSTALTNHSGNITIPNTVIKDSLLRLRVTSDYVGASTPTACSTPQYSQVEDYAVIIVQNLNAPTADFDADKYLTCDGLIKFYDESINGATSWLWHFGDGSTSSSKNPNHTYITPGIYNVKLITSNANGIDSITKNNFIQFHDTIPVSACTPTTNNYCCGYGISNFTFNTINNSTEDGIVGYEDYSCQLRTRVAEGQQYSVSINTSSTLNQTSKIWIDYNNDGLFTDSSELVFTALDQQDPTGFISISGNAVLETPLRMRVVSDYSASNFGSCFNITHGQAEDYTIIIEANNSAPIADFEVTETTSCESTFEFTNLSLNAPDSYIWNFGDGNTSTAENPTHSYGTTGTYTVTLYAYNQAGGDTLVKTDYIHYNSTPKVACIPTTTSFCCNTGANRFQFGDIDNTSGDGSTPYEDFSCDYSTTMQAGKSYPISIRTGDVITERVLISIDLNNDGMFNDSTEQVFGTTNFQFHSGTVELPREAIYNTPLRLRVSTERSSSPPPTACGDLFNGQHEDYTIILTEPDPLGINSYLNNSIEVFPNPVKNMLNIKSDSPIYKIDFYNTLGENIYSLSNPNTSIDLSGLESIGIHILKIETQEGVVTKKIIINEK